jgi:hypothetical protein
MAKAGAKNGGKRRSNRDSPLQPLRIPTGWIVEWNSFFDVEPRFTSWDRTSMHFNTDMLLLSNEHRGVYISLDWFLPHRSSGAFYLRAVRQIQHPEYGRCGDWSRPLRRAKTRSKRKAVETIEAWLDWYSNHDVAASRGKRS